MYKYKHNRNTYQQGSKLIPTNKGAYSYTIIISKVQNREWLK